MDDYATNVNSLAERVLAAAPAHRPADGLQTVCKRITGGQLILTTPALGPIIDPTPAHKENHHDQ